MSAGGFTKRGEHLIPGVNVDALNIKAGLSALQECGYCPDKDERTFMVIEYALMRHAKGEEVEAQRGAIDRDFFGVSLTVWFRVLAHAMTTKE